MARLQASTRIVLLPKAMHQKGEVATTPNAPAPTRAYQACTTWQVETRCHAEATSRTGGNATNCKCRSTTGDRCQEVSPQQTVNRHRRTAATECIHMVTDPRHCCDTTALGPPNCSERQDNRLQAHMQAASGRRRMAWEDRRAAHTMTEHEVDRAMPAWATHEWQPHR